MGPYSAKKDHMDAAGIVAAIILSLLWGFNYSVIKYSNAGVAPVFAATIRSVVASMCGIVYCMVKREKLFHTDIMLFHGFMVGLLFGGEFVCIYFGLLYTDAARAIIFVYLSPFVVALGAHFFLKGDRLTLLKTAGLVLAFAGVITVFYGRPKTAPRSMLLGDSLEIAAAILWGATTLYIKKYMAEKIQPVNTFLYQLVFSIPILLGMSWLLEPRWIYRIDVLILGALFYQTIIVAFMSFMVWFMLIHTYPVGVLSVFTFFTPVFGVLFGTVLLHEECTVFLMVGLPLVCLGIVFVNWRRLPKQEVGWGHPRGP
ncbi:MAG: DMT family transporter [Syntrophorhabdales bacterium]|jgi:drug/metabolite transporter (DMT)-like permease